MRGRKAPAQQSHAVAHSACVDHSPDLRSIRKKTTASSYKNSRNGVAGILFVSRKHIYEYFAALFEECLQRTEMRPGEVITAEVMRVEHNFVVVNTGLKSEAYVPLDEFKNDKGEVEVQVGDFVSVAIG